MNNRYAIVVDGKTVDYLTAENAESAARAYSAEKGLGGVKMLDANTDGSRWAIIKTDGGDITARHTAQLGGLYVPTRKKKAGVTL